MRRKLESGEMDLSPELRGALTAKRGTMAIFEAVARREITPEEGAAEMMANDARRPWWERALRRLFRTEWPR